MALAASTPGRAVQDELGLRVKPRRRRIQPPGGFGDLTSGAKQMTASRLVELVYLMLPAYLAIMAPPFVKYWPGWNRPISRRWLGERKTVIGFAFGVLAGVIAAYVQSRINWSRTLFLPSDWFLIGLAQGFGAMVGDVIKSFYK